MGTTEIRQKLDELIECSVAERDYLLKAYNYYRTDTTGVDSLVRCFAGVRPLLYSASDPNSATRGYAIKLTGKLVTVFGGKWTTALALARNVSQHLH